LSYRACLPAICNEFPTVRSSVHWSTCYSCSQIFRLFPRRVNGCLNADFASKVSSFRALHFHTFFTLHQSRILRFFTSCATFFFQQIQTDKPRKKVDQITEDLSEFGRSRPTRKCCRRHRHLLRLVHHLHRSSDAAERCRRTNERCAFPPFRTMCQGIHRPNPALC